MTDEIYTKDDALAEGEREAVIEELSGKDDITLDDLRRLPDVKDLDDESLQAAWDEVRGESAKPATPAPQRSWRLYRDNAEITDTKAISLDDVFDGKVQFGYTAMGKEQRKAFTDMLRVAQYGHLNESKLSRAEQNAKVSYENWKKFEAENSKHREREKLLDFALDSYLRGDNRPLEQLLKNYSDARSRFPVSTPPPSNDSERRMAGQQVYYEVVVPRARDLAQRYGAPEKEISDVIMQIINSEQPEFFNQERFRQILEDDIVLAIEQAGYVAAAAAARATAPAAPVASSRDPEIAALKQELAALKANQQTDNVRRKAGKTPPAGSPGKGDVNEAAVPAAATKSAAAYREYLKSGG